jgi:hypothetical protein
MILFILASCLVVVSQTNVHGRGFFSSGLRELESCFGSDIIQQPKELIRLALTDLQELQ